LILRISGEGEPLTALKFQNRALAHIKKRDIQLPVPECLNSRHGRSVEIVTRNSIPHGVRLMTYVPGVPTLGKTRSTALRRDIGSHLARLDRALEGLGVPPVHQNLLWDIQKAGNLRELSRFISDSNGRRLVEQTFTELVSNTLPQLVLFTQQTIHNDFNPKNVLANPVSPDHVSGIIDFGDMISGPRIVDLGVAIARHLEPANVVECACDILSGYHDVTPLNEAEISVLFTLICTRLAIRSAIWSWRHALGDVRANPNEVKSALQFLDVLHSRGPLEIKSMFFESCRVKSLED